MSKVLGKDVIVYIYDDGQWKMYACGTNCTLEVTTDFIETSVKGNGKFRNFVPTVNSFTGSIEGLVNFDLDNTLSLQDLRSKQLAHTKLLMQFERTDTTGVFTYVDEAYFFISSSSDSGPVDGMNSFSISLIGTGALTQSFVPTPVNPSGKVKRYEYTSASGGETSFSATALNLVDVIEVVKDGMGKTELITSGTPSLNQVKYTSAAGNGTIEFAIPFEAGEKAYVLYQDI